MTEVERIELEYRDSNSDKVYIAILLKLDDKYKVEFRYGRRGNVNNINQEPNQPVTYGEALGIYQKKIDQKLKKGYVTRK